MLLKEIIWIDKFALKIQRKHHVTVVEVEESLLSRVIFRRSRRGMIEGEDVYLAYGKTLTGRYLFTVFIYKGQNMGLILSARDMTLKERRYYNARKKS